jgi:hypothetical protein
LSTRSTARNHFSFFDLAHFCGAVTAGRAASRANSVRLAVREATIEHALDPALPHFARLCRILRVAASSRADVFFPELGADFEEKIPAVSNMLWQMSKLIKNIVNIQNDQIRWRAKLSKH